jgi:hypothetical protein
MPTAPGAVNDSLLKSPVMQISHLEHDVRHLSGFSPNDYGRLDRTENSFDDNDFVQVCEQLLLLPMQLSNFHLTILVLPFFPRQKNQRPDKAFLNGVLCSGERDIIYELSMQLTNYFLEFHEAERWFVPPLD